MPIQTIFKAGNSQVVSMPPDILTSLNLKTGDKVSLEGYPETDSIVIRKANAQPKISQTEFNKWLNKILEEDAELLDMLA